MISSPRFLVIGLAALFSAYHVVLAAAYIDQPRSPFPVLLAMALYTAVTAASLWVRGPVRMPIWLAAIDVAVGAVMQVLVLSQLDPHDPSGYASWSIAAYATLMIIVVVRQQPVFAWTGIVVVAVCAVFWAGPVALSTKGVIGGAIWVGVAHAVIIALGLAEREVTQFVRAGARVAEWQASHDAFVYDRRVRLDQMNRMAAPMLRTIIARGGAITDDERLECLHVEAAIRDEIRGRLLLTEQVRTAVMAARRRGAQVMMMDDGGLDDLPRADHDRVLAILAATIEASKADRIIVRTEPAESSMAVTVVGLTTTGDSTAVALGDDNENDEIEVWREIPRSE
jgi:hypothetical protein